MRSGRRLGRGPLLVAAGLAMLALGIATGRWLVDASGGAGAGAAPAARMEARR